MKVFSWKYPKLLNNILYPMGGVGSGSIIYKIADPDPEAGKITDPDPDPDPDPDTKHCLV